MRNGQPGMTFSYQQPASFNRLSVAEVGRGQKEQEKEKAFEPFKRVASLPPRKQEQRGAPVEESHIKIVESVADVVRDSKERKRAKIFRESPPRRPMSVPKPVQIVEQQTPPRLVNQYKTVTPSSPFLIQQPLPDPDIEQRVYHRILDKLSQTQLSPLRETNVSLTKKEQEIHFLKLEIERMRRCEEISQENQSLYQRLVGKLREVDERREERSRSPGRMSVVQRSKKKSVSPKRDSPGRKDLSDTIILQQVQEYPSSIRGEESVLVNRRPQERRVEASPLDQHRTTFMSIQNSPHKSDTLTFNRPNKRSHSKRVREGMSSVADRSRSRHCQNIENQMQVYEMPMTQRLGEINGQLERSIIRNGQELQQRGRFSSAMNWTTSSPALLPSQTGRRAGYGRYPRMAL